MKIERIHIDRFAGLTDFDLSLSEGLNIIEGRNESGKSTVAAFIKFLFYGLSGQKTGNELSERERMLPFDSAYAGGNAVLACEDGHYILERRLSVSSSGIRESVRDEVILMNSDTGERLDVGRDVGQFFFGVGSKTFCDTAFFRQLYDTAPDRGELTEAIGNILFSGEEGTDSKKAMKRLEELRTALRHKKGAGGELAELEETQTRLAAELREAEEANRAIIALEGEISDRTAKLEMLESRRKAAQSRAEAGRIAHTLCLRKEKNEYDARAEEAREKLLRLTPDGSLPELEDIMEARRTTASLPILREASKKAFLDREAIAQELRNTPDYSELTEAAADCGGADLLRDRAGSFLRHRRRRLALGLAFLLSGILLLLTGFLNGNLTIPLPGAVFFAAGGAFLLLGILFLVLSAKSRKQACQILDLFGHGCSYDVFSEKISDYKRDHERLCALTEKLHTAEDACDQASLALSAAEKEAQELLRRLSGDPDEELCDALKAAADRAERRRAEATELSAAYRSAKQHADSLAPQLGQEKEETLLKRLSELGIKDAEKIRVSDAEKEVNLYATQAGIQEKEIHAREIALAAQRAKVKDPVEIAGKLAEAQETYAKKTRQYAACMKAIEAMETASQNLRGGVAPYLSDGACRRLSAVTGGKYAGLRVDGDLSAVCVSAGGIRSLEYLSAGTRDLAYVSLRLALIDLLYKKEKPPLIFDESLAHQDAERTEKALTLLAKEGETGAQSLLFTCRGVEAHCAEQANLGHRVLLFGKEGSGQS